MLTPVMYATASASWGVMSTAQRVNSGSSAQRWSLRYNVLLFFMVVMPF